MPPLLKEKKSLIVLFTLIFLQLVLISLQVPLEEKNYFEKTIFSVFSPIQHAVVSSLQKIGGLWNSYFYLRDVKRQNKELKDEAFSLRQENILLRKALQDLIEEQKMKKRLLNVHDHILAADVIGLDNSNIYRSIIINKGSLDGLMKNMVVVDKYGHLVGRIIGPVAIKESKVQLITDQESGVSVYSQEKRIQGIISGDGKGGCLLKYILTTTDEVSEGEALMTSGFDGIYPSGIRVGEVVSITSTTSLFKEIKVKPFFHFRHLAPVAVFLWKPQ